MTKSFVVALLIVLGCAAGTDAWACSARGGCAFSAGSYLAAHNKYRARHCVPALGWSAALAAQAQAWANRCQFEHSPSQTRGGAGENLYFAMPEMRNVDQGVNSWYSEASQYNYNTTRYVP